MNPDRRSLDRSRSPDRASPSNVNTEMPLGNPAPSEDERRQLSVWLACGAPQ